MTDLTTWTLAELEAAIQSPTGGEWTRAAGMELARRIRTILTADTAAFIGTFGWVLEGLRSKKRFRRAGWNGKGMFVYLVDGSTFTVNRDPLAAALGKGAEVQYLPHIDIKTADGPCVPWQASQADMLETDWEEA